MWRFLWAFKSVARSRLAGHPDHPPPIKTAYRELLEVLELELRGGSLCQRYKHISTSHTAQGPLIGSNLWRSNPFGINQFNRG
jgi:hypothetical protein